MASGSTSSLPSATLKSTCHDFRKRSNDFVISYKQLLYTYDEVRDPDEILKIQKDVSEKQYRFMSFMERNQELFSDQIEITQSDEHTPKRKTKANYFFWFFGKAYLICIPFIFSLLFVSMIFNGIAFLLLKINSNLARGYFFITSLIDLYFYGFYGAYYQELFEYYTGLFGKKWLILIGCIFPILILLGEMKRELNLAKIKLNQNGVFSFNFENDILAEDFPLIATIYNFRGRWMILVSFILFIFLPTWTEKLYGNLPNYLATLFL